MSVPPAFADLLRVLAGLRRPSFDPPVVAAFNAWLSTEVPSHLGPVVLTLRQLPLAGAATAAVWLGSCVERGADPDGALPTLLDVLQTHAEALDPDAPDADDLEGLQWLGQGVVAHLVASPTGREAAQQHAGLLEALEEVSGVSVGAVWVEELLLRRSGTLVLLHGTEPWGHEVTFAEIGNAFHLFTLLQRALPMDLGDPHTAWFHYQQPTAGPEPLLGASIWGEASLDTIERVDGVPVMVCFPPLLGRRGWDESFFGPAIDAAPSRVRVRPLSDEEQARWRARLGW
jgi:hypothetical protein